MSLPPSSAPTATGWSDSCRAGFAPAEEWRLSRRTRSSVLAGRSLTGLRFAFSVSTLVLSLLLVVRDRLFDSCRSWASCARLPQAVDRELGLRLRVDRGSSFLVLLRRGRLLARPCFSLRPPPLALRACACYSKRQPCKTAMRHRRPGQRPKRAALAFAVWGALLRARPRAPHDSSACVLGLMQVRPVRSPACCRLGFPLLWS